MCVEFAAVNWNQTSSSAVPPHVFGSGEAVALVTEPEMNNAQSLAAFTGAMIGVAQLSLDGVGGGTLTQTLNVVVCNKAAVAV